MTARARQWLWWGVGGAAGLGALALLTVLAVYLSAAFVIRYAQVPDPALHAQGATQAGR